MNNLSEDEKSGLRVAKPVSGFCYPKPKILKENNAVDGVVYINLNDLRTDIAK